MANRPEPQPLRQVAGVRGTPVELDLWPVVNLFAPRGGTPRLLIEVDIGASDVMRPPLDALDDRVGRPPYPSCWPQGTNCPTAESRGRHQASRARIGSAVTCRRHGPGHGFDDVTTDREVVFRSPGATCLASPGHPSCTVRPTINQRNTQSSFGLSGRGSAMPDPSLVALQSARSTPVAHSVSPFSRPETRLHDPGFGVAGSAARARNPG